MLKKYTFIAVICTTVFFLNSYKKEYNDSNEPENEQELLLKSAKSWYSDQSKLSNAESSVSTKKYAPKWSKAKFKLNSKNQLVIGVPLSNGQNNYTELNVVVIDGSAYGVIKSYTKDNSTKLT